MNLVPYDTDVFVAGGGPAGLATAIAARRQGFQVVVADASTPPVDKVCGEGLMPDGVEALRALGVSLAAEDTFRFCGIRFHGFGLSTAADFPAGDGIGIRRTKLHQALINHALETGATLLWNTCVTGIESAGVALDGGRLVRARWIVGADGASSRVRRWAGLDDCRARRQRFGFRRHYRIAPWTSHMEIYWGSGCQLYLTPVSEDEICLVAISKNHRVRLDDVLPGFPEVFERVRNAPLMTAERGAATVTRHLSTVSTDRIALVGDASGSVDAITGAGMSLAFRHASALAPALANGDLAAYRRSHRALSLVPSLMANLMLTMDNRTWLRRRVLRAFAERPAIFAGLLATHVGTSTPARSALDGLALGWQLLTQ